MKRDVRCRLRSGLYFNLSAAASRECQHRQRDHENTHALPSKSWGSFVREACKRQAPLTAQNPTPSKYTERAASRTPTSPKLSVYEVLPRPLPERVRSSVLPIDDDIRVAAAQERE